MSTEPSGTSDLSPSTPAQALMRLGLALLLAIGTLTAMNAVAADAGLGGADDEIPEEIVTLEWLVDEITPGETVRTAMVFNVPEGWHTYWDGRNDTGFPASMKFELPPGLTVADTLWPAPQRYVSPGDILDHVYMGTYPLFLDVVWDPDATVPSAGSVDLTCTIDWLVCREACIFESDTLFVSVPVVAEARVAAEGNQLPSEAAARLAELRRAFEPRLPRPAGADEFSFEWSSGSRKDQEEAGLETPPSVVELSVPGATRVEFYPKDEGARLLLPLVDAAGKGSRLRLRTETGEQPLEGVLAAFGTSGNARYLDVSIPRR